MTKGTKLKMLLVVFCFVFTNFINSRGLDSDAKRHHIESMGLSIALPLEWRISKSTETEVKFKFNSRDYPYKKHRIDITIHYDEMTFDSDEDTLFKDMVDVYKRLSSTKFETSSETKIDGKRTQWLTYTISNKKVLQYIFLKNKRALMILCGSKKEIFPDHLSIFKKIVHSIKFDK